MRAASSARRAHLAGLAVALTLLAPLLLPAGRARADDPFFAYPTALAGSGPNAFGGAVGDLNGDGAADLLLNSYQLLGSPGATARPSQLFLSKNDGSGTFQSPTDLPGGAADAWSSALADFDGDGRADIALALSYPSPSRLLLNTAGSPGTFAAPLSLPAAATTFGGFPFDFFPVGTGSAAVDLNRDGRMDLVIASYGYPSVVYRNNGGSPPTFTGSVLQPGDLADVSFPNTYAVAAGDLNGDGWPDLVLGNDGEPSQVYLGAGGGALSATPIDLPGSGRTTFGVTLADLNGDGRLDIVLANSGDQATPQPSQVYLNTTAAPASLSFGAPADLADSGPSLTRAAAAADVNGDGAPDLILANFGAISQVYVNRGDGTGTFTAPQSLIGSGSFSSGAALGDLNGDAQTDLVLVNRPASGGPTVPAQIFLSNRGGAFSAAAFGTPIPITASSGRNGKGVRLGDLNGDGALDMLVVNAKFTNTGPRPSQILIGSNGPGGSFSPPADLAGSGLATSDGALGDLNGDGLLDIALSNDGAPAQVFLNSTAAPGSFGAPADLPGAVGEGRSIALADLNGDGLLDVVVGDKGAAAPIRYYLNTPGQPGTFGGPVTVPGTGGATLGIAAGDLNGDGRPDLVLANYLTVFSQVLINQGGAQPTFAVAQLAGSGNATDGVALGDLNGDGLLDVVLSNFGYASQVYTNLAASPGTFGAPAALGGSGGNSIGVDVADLNGDGALDVVLGNYAGQLSQVFLNLGTGRFAAPSALAGSGRDTTRLAVGDVNGDGALDVVLGNSDLPSQIFLNADVSGFAAPEALAGGGRNTLDVAVGDVNGDGVADLVLANYGGAAQVALGRTGARRFDLPADLQGSWLTRGVALGDLDGDGRLDVVLANYGQPAQVYLNGPGGYGAPAALGGSPTAQRAAVGDLNGDGLLDIVLAVSDAPSLVYMNTPGAPGTFGPPAQLPGSGRSTLGVRLGDLNGDGLLDIALANYGDAQLSQVYLNDGSGSFASVAPSDLAGTAGLSQDVGVADLNGDGASDIVLAKFRQPSQVLLGDGAGGFGAPLDIASTGNFSNRMALADLNGDGAPDLVLANMAGGGLTGAGDQPSQVLLNRRDGSGLFGAPLGLTGGVGFIAVAAGDLDGDGAADLAFAAGDGIKGAAGQPARIYMNTRARSARMPALPPAVGVGQPGGAPAADGYATAQIISSATAAVTYTLASPDRSGVREVRAEYSVDGGQSWRPAIAATGSVTTGVFLLGSAPQFDGAGQGMTVPNLAALPRGNAPHTVEAWVRADRYPAQSSRPLLLGTAGAGAHGWLLTADGRLQVGAVGGAQVSPALALGRWTHVAASFDGATLRVYVDGQLAGSAAASFDLQGAPLTLALPGFAGESPFAGSVDELRVWGAARGQAEIQADMRRDVSPSAPGLAAYYRFDEGGPRAADSSPAGATGTLTGGAPRIAPALPYPFVWDVRASGFFGQSDGVRLRVEALPGAGLSSGGVSGPYRRPYASATTFPFRVRGTQVRVLDGGAPAAGAIVLRRPAGATAFSLVAPSARAAAFRTNSAGFLLGRGSLAVGDELVALSPVATTGPLSASVTLYHTNLTTTAAGVSGAPVAQLGEQTLQTTAARPLALFNLIVSLEWDARGDARYMAQLQSDLARASELLFAATGGQVALGQVAVFHDKENWDYADVRVYATNRLRPSAAIGGVTTAVITDPVSISRGDPPASAIVYAPGQVRMGAVWNRFGNASGSSLSEDWPRTLAHELGHYLLFADDNYIGRNAQGAIVPVDTCPGLMSDPYVGQVRLRPAADWLPGCAETFSNVETGRSDWASAQAFYPALVAPQVGYAQLPDGPASMPLEITEVRSVDPLTPTARLDVPIFYTVTSAGRFLPTRGARGYLFQQAADGPRITALGRPNIDQVLARGARVGDEVCLYDPGAPAQAPAGGCLTVAPGVERLTLADRSGWAPDVRVTPATSVTLQLRVGGVPADVPGLRARLYPLDGSTPPTADLTLAPQGGGVYSATATFAAPVEGAYVRVWADEPAPRRELVTEYAVGGNAGGGFRTGGGGGFRTGGGGGFRTGGGGGFRTGGGGGFRTGGGGGFRTGGGSFLRSGGAPVASVEGDVLLVGEGLTFQVGQFMALQSTLAIPPAPPWATLIGSGYRFTTSASAPDLTGAQLQFNYLGGEVPAGEEDGIKVYYLQDGASQWRALTTTLDAYHNQASAPYQGPGLYALMSSIDIPLAGASWNLFAYPVQGPPRAPAEALASVAGQYDAVYGYDPADAADPWKVYSPSAPAWVSDLAGLEFGRGYWISVTAAGGATLQLRGSGAAGQSGGRSLALPTPPATLYGAVAGRGRWAPAAGLPVEARVGGALCGSGVTRLEGGQVVYAVDVASAGQSGGCGADGQPVALSVGGRELARVPWQAGAHRADIGGNYTVDLPVLARP